MLSDSLPTEPASSCARTSPSSGAGAGSPGAKQRPFILSPVPLSAHAKRQRMILDGLAAETVRTAEQTQFEYSYRGPHHLLVLIAKGRRIHGETVAGDARSALHDMSRKLIFIPAGTAYRDEHHLQAPSHIVLFYIDPDALAAAARSREDSCLNLVPRLFFEDAVLLATAEKLAALIETPASDSRPYLEALGKVLAHELLRAHRPSPQRRMAKGGLAPWQQKRVAEHIDEHLAETVPVARLAALAELSTFHFCRAFKQSFGMPPHRYHTARRIEHAKTLLAGNGRSVTEVAIAVGFGETSSFSTAFRKATGLTPSAYLRNLA